MKKIIRLISLMANLRQNRRQKSKDFQKFPILRSRFRENKLPLKQDCSKFLSLIKEPHKSASATKEAELGFL